MRVFLTGGTGYVGSAVLDSLVRGGHHVDALVRNSVGAATVQARGAHPVLGDLLQPASWADAVIVVPRGRCAEGIPVMATVYRHDALAVLAAGHVLLCESR